MQVPQRTKILTFTEIIKLKNMVFDIEMIKRIYSLYPERIEAARKLVGRPLTLTEKILYTHLWEGNASQVYSRGESYVDLPRIVLLCKMQLLKWPYCNLCKQEKRK